MTHFAIEPLVQSWGLWGLGLDIFFESMGLPLPGETLLVIAAGLAAAGQFDIRAVMLVAFLAAVAGDNLGYLIGRLVGRPVILRWGGRIGITRERLDRVEEILDRRGAIVVTVARFIVVLRQLNGLAAGTARMHWLHFLLANALGAALWVGSWTALAWFFGADAAKLLPIVWHWALHSGALVWLVLIGGLALVWWRSRSPRER